MLLGDLTRRATGWTRFRGFFSAVLGRIVDGAQARNRALVRPTMQLRALGQKDWGDAHDLALFGSRPRTGYLQALLGLQS